jgi:hypothetical protein
MTNSFKKGEENGAYSSHIFLISSKKGWSSRQMSNSLTRKTNEERWDEET